MVKRGEKMGILGSIIGKVITDVAAPAVTEKVKQTLYSKNKDNFLHKDEFFEKLPGFGVLVVNQRLDSERYEFDVYDENRVVKYTVKDKLMSLKHCLYIFDYNGNKLGMIKEKLVAIRSPISLESTSVDFIIEINGRKLGKVKSRWAFGGNQYDVDFTGWKIVGNITGLNYKILSRYGEIADISSKLFRFGNTYSVTYPDIRNELLVLMLVLAIDAASATRRAKEYNQSL